jgi:hypothetical protein
LNALAGPGLLDFLLDFASSQFCRPGTDRARCRDAALGRGLMSGVGAAMLARRRRACPSAGKRPLRLACMAQNVLVAGEELQGNDRLDDALNRAAKD